MLKIAFILSIVFLSTMIVPVHASCIEHIEDCITDIVDSTTGPMVRDAIYDLETDVINPIKTDVDTVEKKVASIEDSLGDDIGTIVKDIGSDVNKIEEDAESLENVVVNDIKNDIKIIKEDVQKLTDVVKSVEKIEKKVVHFSEDLIKFIWDDFGKDVRNIIYVGIAIGVGYLVIRIIPFALWLKAYLRQDGIEHYVKKQVVQNEEIIELLKKIAKNSK
jgi:hypothetical protein